MWLVMLAIAKFSIFLRVGDVQQQQHNTYKEKELRKTRFANIIYFPGLACAPYAYKSKYIGNDNVSILHP